MNTAAFQHFQSVDPILFSVFKKISDKKTFTLTKSSDIFSDLVESIICQQLSNKAGSTIFLRFCALFPKHGFTPKQVLEMPDEKIRSTGPSWSKISYIKSIAWAVESGQLNLRTIDAKSDEDVIIELTKIRGIGRWTAEMFLMFTLGREDIFSFGDLGLRRAIMKLYKMKKEPTIRQMEKLTNRWKPYRTYAAKILWMSLEI
ncbi:DNA-3-methyladenine glycosylase 2 family protein [Candidatus Gottesmanbacteria bacterium]|nr:DNA-3-methyladenine glycosylase 2 family protein [Candidatus Gottesmanbacteria bacterium]